MGADLPELTARASDEREPLPPGVTVALAVAASNCSGLGARALLLAPGGLGGRRTASRRVSAAAARLGVKALPVLSEKKDEWLRVLGKAEPFTPAWDYRDRLLGRRPVRVEIHDTASSNQVIDLFGERLRAR